MINKFKVGDHVFASDWCYGEIVSINGEVAEIQFDTGFGQSTYKFNISDLQHLRYGAPQNHIAKVGKKDRVIACIEYSCNLLMAILFAVVAVFALIFREWFVAGLGAVLFVKSGYNAMKSLCRCGEFSEDRYEP